MSCSQPGCSRPSPVCMMSQLVQGIAHCGCVCAGQNNINQRIQHHQKVKDENNFLKAELAAVRQQNADNAARSLLRTHPSQLGGRISHVTVHINSINMSRSGSYMQCTRLSILRRYDSLLKSMPTVRTPAVDIALAACPG